MVLATRPDGKRQGKRIYRRRAIVLVDVVSVAMYLEALARGSVSSPVPCPDRCHGTWSRHSTFERTWVDSDCVAYTLVIVRVRCSACSGVWSLFPGFVWYRFRFSYRLVQSACHDVLSGLRSTAVAEALEARVSLIVKERVAARVPAESTIRSWVQWLGQPCLIRLVRVTLSLIARRSAEGARATLSALGARPALPVASNARQRARRILQVCSALDGVTKGRLNLARRSPHQLRDWAHALFRELRQPLARPP